ncbi:MAG: GIY-YIG nuclease family protein [Bacteroidia bacterium]|nr:GIY-YIG nuclease family protein [Bacteroidia bacterium]
MTDSVSQTSALFFTYILYSKEHSRFYIGQTQNLAGRLERHNKGAVKSTQPYIPWILIGNIEKNNRKEAMILEKKLKNLNTEDLKKFMWKYFPDCVFP